MKRPQLFLRRVIAYSFISGILLQPFQNIYALVQEDFAQVDDDLARDAELSLEEFVELVRDQLSYEELAEIIETHKDDLDADGNPDTRAWFKIYANLTVRGRLNAGNLNVRNDARIQGNLTVEGTINGGGSGAGDVTGPSSSTLNAVARYADTTGKVIKDSTVLVDDAGNVTLDGITKNGNTVSWPSVVGAANTVLTSDGAGNLIYSTPAGSGNVSTAANFTTNNALITVDLPSGAQNIKQTSVILDGANNISGVNALSVTGPVTISSFGTAGVVHNDASGNLSSSLVVGNDIANNTIPDSKLQTISTAGKVANSATTATSVNTPNTIVLRDGSGNFSAGTITANLNGNATTATSATTAGTATNFTGPLAGDVTGTQAATHVALVGGQTAANVASATVLANNATNLNTPSTIVRRDASGNFSANIITANLNGNAATATTAGSFSGNLAGDVTGPQSATVVAFVGGQSAANVAATTVTVNAATSSNTPNTLVKRDGSGNFAAGQITASNFVATNGTNQLTLGSGPTTTITAPNPALSRTYTIPDTGANSSFVMTDLNQTINGSKTLTGITTFNNTAILNNQNILRFVDAGGTNFVGLQAPTAVTSSYSIALPATAPTGAGQVLTSISPSATQWATAGGATISQIVYVAVNGNDVTGNGSFIAPYASLKRALVDANTVATAFTPVEINIGPGFYVENNSTPLQITATPINIVGASPLTTILFAAVPSNNFLEVPVDASLSQFTIASANPLAGGIGLVVSGANNLSVFINVIVQGFTQGWNLSGGATTEFYLNGCAAIACATGIVLDNAHATIFNQTFIGTSSVPNPQFAGFTASGLNGVAIVESAAFFYCSTAAQVSNQASVEIIGGSFTTNDVAIQCGSQSATTVNGSTFLFNGVKNISVQDPNTTLQATSCNINGISPTTNFPSGIGLQVIDGAIVNIAASSFTNLVDGIVTGSATDANQAQLFASGVTLQNCTDKQLIQNDLARVTFVGGSFDRTSVSINNPVNIVFNTSDSSSDQATLIGQHADQDQNLILVDTGNSAVPVLRYEADYNGSKGLIYFDQTGTAPALLGAQSGLSDAVLSAVTNQNTQAAKVQLYSGIDDLSAAGLRGWEMVKTGTTANLAFNFVNTDALSTTTVNRYTSFYADGFNNVLNFPSTTGTFAPTNATTVLNWASDTNLYRASTSLLKTDNQLAIGTLNASAAGFALTAATAGNVIQKSATSAAELGFVQGVTSSIQTQLNNKLSLSGGTLTGALTLPTGSPAAPSLNFAGFPTTGLSATGGALKLDTANGPALVVSPSGNITIAQASSGTTLTVTGGGASISGNLTIPSGSGRIITDAITINNAPVNATDGTNKAYVDSVAVGLQVKAPCRVVDAVNSITPANFPTIDSVITTTGDRVLLTMETNGVQNGIWQINNGGIWVRPTDFPSGGSAASAYTFIQEGAIFAGSSWICTNTVGSAIIDTNSLNFVEFSAPQSITGANVGTGAGVFRDKTGSTLNFRSLNSPDSNIVVTQNTDDISIMLSSNPSISSLNVSGQVTAGTLSDGAGVTISGGIISAADLIATTTLRAGNGSAAFPSIDFIDSPLTGFSAEFPDTLVVSTAGVNRLQINAAGTINIPAFTPAGIVHNDASGNLSSSLIVNADVSPTAAIVDTKLATITTAGKVANSATTATSADTPNAIVSRDGSGNFAANQITADSKFLAANGTVALPSISFTASTNAGLSSPVASQLSLSSGGAERIRLQAGGSIQFPSSPYAAVGVLHTDALGVLSTSAVSLTTDVSGVLPIANGGTNSATALNNNRIMVSLGGAIVESAALNNGQILIGSGAGSAPVVANIAGTTNQINVTNGAGSITLSTPQNIATISTPTFVSLTLTNATNQLILGSGNTTTINAAAPAASHVYTIPDVLTNAQFVMTEGNQIINGNKTLSGITNLSSLTPSLPLQLDASKNIISAPFTPAAFSGVLTVTQGGTGTTSIGSNAILASNSTGTAIIPLANLTNGQLFIGSTGTLPVANTITQASANQVIVTSGAGSITLATPQDIATTSSPRFASATLTNAANQLTLGSGNNVTLSAQSLTLSHTFYYPDVTATSTFVMTDGNQVINGNKTLSGTTNLSGLTASLPLQLDANKNIIAAPLTPASFSGILPITNGGTGSSALGTNAMLASNATGTAVIPLANLTNGQLFIGSTGNLPVANTITQASANQVIVTNGAGSITLATPQDIATTSSPTFASETLTNIANQLTLGSGNTITLSAPTPAASRTYYIPDVLSTSTFVMVDGTQTINGLKTFNNTVKLANQHEIDLYDATNTNFVGIKAPAAATSYTFALPAAAPTGAGQVLSSLSASATQWATTGGAGVGLSNTIYVAKNGNDVTGNGSYTAPYASLTRALVDANATATPAIPVQIIIGPGIFVENNSTPLTINPATPNGRVNIVGASTATTILVPTTPANDFLVIPVSANLHRFTLASTNPFVGRGIVCSGAGNNSIFVSMLVQGFGQGFNLTGGTTTEYYLNGSVTIACGTGVVLDNARAAIFNQTFIGSASIPTPQFAGLLATGTQALSAIESAAFLYCSTGGHVSNNASIQFIGGSFIGNNTALLCDTQANVTVNGSTFVFNNTINMQVQDNATTLQATSCNINGLSPSNIPAGIGLQAVNGALINIAASSFANLVDGIITGSATDANQAQLFASGVTLQNCTDKQLIQNDLAHVTFVGGDFDRTAITINNPVNIVFNTSDSSNAQATLIGQHADQDQNLILVDTGNSAIPVLRYDSNYNGAKGVLYFDQSTQVPILLGVQSGLNEATLSAVTNQNTQAARVQLYSGAGDLVGASLRGWEMVKTATTANLAFNFVNGDALSTTTVNRYTSFYADGFNNVLNFPSTTGTFPPTNATTVLNWASDTNLYRASADLLKTDDNFAIGTLGASAAGFVLTAASAGNVVQVSPTSATELGFVQGVTSPIQTQLNNKLSLSGGTLTGALTLPVGSPAAPSLNFTGFATTGLSVAGGSLQLDTAASPRISINSSGNVTIAQASSGTTLTVTGGGASISGNLTIPSGSGRIITDAITINNAPVNSTDGTNKAYVDSVAVGLQVKAPCRVVDAVNSITPANFPTIDSVITTTGDRVLLTMETNGVQNGIWVVGLGPWTRPTDFPSGGSAASAYTFIQEGAVFAGSSWICTNTVGSATIDTNSLTFVEFSSPQNTTGANIGTGAGVFANKVGSTLNFRSLNSPNANIVVTQNTNDISIALSNSPSISSLAVSGAVTAGTFSDGAGVTISGGTINANNAIVTTTIRAGAGSAAFPSIDFVGSPLTGFSAQNLNTLVVSTAGASRLQINAAGTINIPAFTSAGIVHNSSSGDLSSSLIVNADVSPTAAIVDTKLATISTSGKVANSATTATSADTPNAIVARDGSGNFASNIITADSNFFAANGTVTNPSISFTNSPGVGLSSPVAGQLALSSGSTGVLTPLILLNASGTQIQFPSTLYATPGVLHTDATGVLSTSLIVDADVSASANIADTKLATISTAGKVANSATTATSANTPNTIVLRNASGNFTAGLMTGTATFALNSGTFAGNLAGDVTGPQSATVVALVGGVTAANVASGANAANAATSANTPNTIVLRNASGNFSAGLMTGTATFALNSGSFTGNLAGDVTGPQSATVVATVGGVTAANVASGANAANAATSINTPNTIVKRDASGNFAASTITTGSLFATNSANQLILSSGVNQLIINSGTSAAARTYTVPDAGTVSSFVMNSGAATQTISSPLTFSNIVKLSSLSPSLPLQLDASNNIISQAIALNTSSVTGILPIANGGTNSGTALAGNRIMVSSTTPAIVEAAALTNGQLLIGSSGAAPVANSIAGTPNQVIVTNGAGTISLSLPQSIATSSSPTFASETLTNVTNQLTLGTTNQIIINAAAPAATRTYTIPETGANSSFVMTDGNQTINGSKTLSGTTTFAAGSAATPSIQFTGSTNTGLSAAVANTLVLSTNGNSRLSIDSAGATTIAAPSAGTALTVNGAAGAATALVVSGTGQFSAGLDFSTTPNNLAGNFLHSVGSFPAVGLRIIAGQVNTASATPVSGTGFTLTTGGTGVITITFTQPFLVAPVITATARGSTGANTSLFPMITTAQTTSAVIFTVVNSGGNATAGIFNFIAIGQA